MQGLGDTGKTVRKDLGIIGLDGTSINEEDLTPLSALPDIIFQRGYKLAILTGAESEGKQLDPREIKFARLAVKLYGQFHEKIRTREGMENYGRLAKVMGVVSISPFGSESRYLVNFITTNLLGDADWSINSNTFIFDLRLEPEGLGDRRSGDHRVVGEKDEQLHVLGRLDELYQKHGEDLITALQQQGYQNFGVICTFDIDRFGGVLKHP